MAENTQTLKAREVHGTAKNLVAHIDDLYDGAVALRRRLHEWPEVGNHLPNTRAAVLESLEGLPLDITVGPGLPPVSIAAMPLVVSCR
ncbi:MAG: hypothetical protein ACKOJG_06330, partial [Actinomycetota bacterium]